MGEKVLCAMGLIEIRESNETIQKIQGIPITRGSRVIECPIAGRRSIRHCWVCPLFIRIVREPTPEDEKKAFNLLCDVKEKVRKSWSMWRLRELKRKGVVV